MTVLWLRELESSWGWGDSFLFLASSGPGTTTGREILLPLSPISRNAREGSAFRDGGELVTRCTGSCIELADSYTVVPEFVISSRCGARVPFEADMLDDLKEDMLYAETF
jgi:hypothetical protein